MVANGETTLPVIGDSCQTGGRTGRAARQSPVARPPARCSGPGSRCPLVDGQLRGGRPKNPDSDGAVGDLCRPGQHMDRGPRIDLDDLQREADGVCERLAVPGRVHQYRGGDCDQYRHSHGRLTTRPSNHAGTPRRPSDLLQPNWLTAPRSGGVAKDCPDSRSSAARSFNQTTA
jgi:hypothetical protein